MGDDRANPDHEIFQQLLVRTRNGDPDAAGRLLMRFRPALLCFARKNLSAQLKAKIDAQDLVQEVFEKAFARLLRFRGDTEKEMKYWLASFLLHELAHVNREFRSGSKRDVGMEEAHLWCGGKGAADSVEPASMAHSPPDDAQNQEWEDAFRLALAKLPPDMRHVIEMRMLNDLSFADIGHRLAIGTDGARKRFDRAFDEFAARFAADQSHGAEPWT